MFNESDLRMAAEIGAELAEASEPIDERIVRARTYALGLQSHEVLGVLRTIRDGCPDEWDAITKSPHGDRLMGLWDMLRPLENELFADED